MSGRITLLLFLAVAALSSGWLLDRFLIIEPVFDSNLNTDPDYYMENFSTITIGENGLPLNKLSAVYMEHNPIDDTLELFEPKLEIIRANNEPLYITAEKGWATDDNEVILLQGKVRMWETNKEGDTTLNIETSEVRILVPEEYGETDQDAIIVGKRTTIKGRGIRVYFNESKLEILDHEQTVIKQPDNN